jgi:hypothetical protein
MYLYIYIVLSHTQHVYIYISDVLYISYVHGHIGRHTGHMHKIQP